MTIDDILFVGAILIIGVIAISVYLIAQDQKGG